RIGQPRRPVVLVVVDNQSNDGSAELVEAHPGPARLLRNEHNSGFAAAVNQGAAATSAPWLLLLNPDMELRPGSLRNLFDFAQQRPGHGIYGGRTLRADGSVEPSSCWNLPTLWSTACFALGLSTLFARSPIFDPESIGNWQRDTVREVGMVTGCLLLVPRAVWDELHGLDERYFVYGEDADFSARARRLGYRPIITPTAEVVHAIGVSSGDGGGKMPLLLAGKLTYARQHGTGWQAGAASWLLRFGVLVRAVGATLTGRGTKWRLAWSNRAQWWNGFPPRQGPADLD
ncbi:MAG: glycosyltransferase, partial [Jatrophihabitantaceae bacterium]